MKLRCVTDSVRLRLSKSDIRRLSATGKVQESLTLGADHIFYFSLQVSTEYNFPHISLQQGHLQVSLPKSVGEEWIDSGRVGIEYFPGDSSGLSVHLLIEKDFPCRDREDEDRSNTFWELSEERGDSC